VSISKQPLVDRDATIARMKTKVLVAVAGAGIENLEWLQIGKLDAYDIVPPSKALFKKLGYL
jgi:hypothetical protein